MARTPHLPYTVNGGALALGLDAAGGRRVSLREEDLPLSGPGGFSATEVVRGPDVKRSVLYRNNFGADAPAWSPMANAHAEQPVGAAMSAQDGNASEWGKVNGSDTVLHRRYLSPWRR